MEKSIRERTEYYKEHYLKNKDRKCAYAKKYREENREKVLELQRKCGKIWFQKNKESVYKKRNHRIKTDLNTRMAETLRKRFRKVVFGVYKKESAIQLIGCSLDYFKEYIESKFTEGMSWNNYGIKGWHIDHIKPCASFDLTDLEQQKICFHYTNMQPLWAFDNYSKGAKI